jgi:hypothetical protein
MQNKPRSPSQIAKNKIEKKTSSFSLNKKNLDIVMELAHANDVPVSEIIDEAIAFYLENVEHNGNNNGSGTKQ